MPNGEDLAILARTLGIALAATLLVVPPGLALAVVFARRAGALRTLVEAIATLPLVLPPTAVGLLLLDALSPRSWLGRALVRASFDVLFDPKGAAIASAVIAFPLMVRAFRLSLEAVDRRLEQAARTLGAGPVDTFVTVTLPLMAPGLLTGVVLAFARSLSEFGATITFVSNIPGETRTLPIALYSLTQEPGGEAAALRLCAISVAVAFAALLAAEGLARRLRRTIGG